MSDAGKVYLCTMFYRKIQEHIERYLTSDDSRVLVIDGARQVGKTCIVRHIGQRLFANYIEINMEEDAINNRLFADVGSKDDFYLALSVYAGGKTGTRRDTLVFIDEIQRYDRLLTLLKFLRQDDRFKYIVSGSLLGVSLKRTSSIPLGSIEIRHMYPMDFEEFVLANGVGREAVDTMKTTLARGCGLPQALHATMTDLFRKYLLAGGMPAAVDAFVNDRNIVTMRDIQLQIYDLYKVDAARYEDVRRRLKIQRIYSMIPSNLENRKKRVVANKIEGRRGDRMEHYAEEFDYLVSAGIALEVKAVSNPCYPLVQSTGKNLLKLYMSDVGIFTALLYRNNIKPVMDDMKSINLGAVYETVVAQELRAHGFDLYYYDNKKNGEVDFIIDDSSTATALPIEVKSGRDYRIHSALNNLLAVGDYNIHRAIVLSNAPEVKTDKGITYLPVYATMLLSATAATATFT